MKKIIALLACLAMLLSMAACGAKTPEVTNPTTEPTTEATEPTDEIVETPDEPIDEPATEGTVGETLLATFKANSTGTAEEIANAVITDPIIPFIGYIFKLAEGTDVEAFKTNLEENANLRWNICTAAEELVIENEGNTVFFLMCPASFEQPEVEGDVGGMDMLPEEGEGIVLG